MRFFSSAERDLADITPGTDVEIEMADRDPAKFPTAVVVTKPADRFAPNDTDRWVWVRYDNDSIVPVRYHQVRVIADNALPTDRAALYTLLAATDQQGRNALLTRLESQVGVDQAWKMFNSIDSEIRNGEQIAEARTDLRRQLHNVELALDAARRVHAQLTGDLYDVEYAEGGYLLRHYLEATELAIRTAVAVNPCRDEKD